LSSSPSPQMTPRWKSLPPGVVTHSSSSVFRCRYHRLWSKVDLGVLFLFGLCEGHLYQSLSCPANYLGLQNLPLAAALPAHICCLRLQYAAMTCLASS
jgi:hypothetical protein